MQSASEEIDVYFVSYAGNRPVPTKATTIVGAMIAASRNCPFQGQVLKVFRGRSAEYAVLVAIKNNDAINTNNRGAWDILDPSESVKQQRRSNRGASPAGDAVVYTVRLPKPLHDRLRAVGPDKVREVLSTIRAPRSRSRAD